MPCIRVFNSMDYAQYIKLSEVQARVAMMNLANDGYLQYNQDERLATINTKTFDHIGYVSGRRDHDVIRLDSKPRKGNNAEWSLLNGALQVNGVNRLVFSQARGVFIEPDGEEVQVAAGRDMTLSGLVHAGNVKLNGKNMAFDYDAFTIDFNKINEVQLSVNDLETLNYRGEPKKIWLKNSLQDISGSLAIDAPFNRSGNESDLHPTYPEFSSQGTGALQFDTIPIQAIPDAPDFISLDSSNNRITLKAGNYLIWGNVDAKQNNVGLGSGDTQIRTNVISGGTCRGQLGTSFPITTEVNLTFYFSYRTNFLFNAEYVKVIDDTVFEIQLRQTNNKLATIQKLNWAIVKIG